jgi:hypothetical protein
MLHKLKVSQTVYQLYIPVANTGSEAAPSEEDDHQDEVEDGSGQDDEADKNLQNDLDGLVRISCSGS